MKLGDCHLHVLTIGEKVCKLCIGRFPDRVRVREWTNDPGLFHSPLASRWRREVFDHHAPRERLIEIQTFICPPDVGPSRTHYLVNRAAGEVTDLISGKVIGRDW